MSLIAFRGWTLCSADADADTEVRWNSDSVHKRVRICVGSESLSRSVVLFGVSTNFLGAVVYRSTHHFDLCRQSLAQSRMSFSSH
jgi:hypothetical protein